MMTYSDILPKGWLNTPQAEDILQILNQYGESRFVGGCVRNYFLNEPIDDIDIATTALPEVLLENLPKHNIECIPTGIAHGTVTIVYQGKNFEVTTLRKDIQTDGRHAIISNTNDWQEDAKRRDFTINALYVDAQGQLYNYVDGLENLKEKKIIFIGNAEQRIQEDYLRILRYFRFASRFDIKNHHQDTLNIIKALSSGLNNISIERINSEFIKIFQGMGVLHILSTMQDLNILNIIFDNNTHLNIQALEKFKTLTQQYNYKAELIDYLLVVFKQIPQKILKKLPKKQQKKYSFTQSLQAQLQKHEILKIYIDSTIEDALFYTFYTAINANMPKNEITKIIKIITRPEKTIFPITGHDIKSLGYEGEAISQKMNHLKTLWCKSEFNLGREVLLKSIPC